jgi:hypothetical protein
MSDAFFSFVSLATMSRVTWMHLRFRKSITFGSSNIPPPSGVPLLN